jgi:5-formyltetrahydrofolate cyclo-ligase
MDGDLGIDVNESVRAQEAFGDLAQKLKAKGIGGTLHLVNEEDKIKVIDSAWQLSKTMGMPVIIVVRAR